jgi:hypothetical protein
VDIAMERSVHEARWILAPILSLIVGFAAMGIVFS